VRKNKGHDLNYNAPVYNARTKLYDTTDGKNMTYAEATRNKWKCEKCSASFSNYKSLFVHKKQGHSY
jgi:hypothetical protein